MYALLALFTKCEKDSRDTAFNRYRWIKMKFSSSIRFQIKFNQGGRENEIKQFKFKITMCESLNDMEISHKWSPREPIKVSGGN